MTNVARGVSQDAPLSLLATQLNVAEGRAHSAVQSSVEGHPGDLLSLHEAYP